MKKKMTLFGAGDAISCVDVTEAERKFQIECILDKYPSKKYLAKYKNNSRK